jgi:hypothetical protein
MLVLGFQLVVEVLVINVFPESDYYIDIVFVVREVT